jgi:hypothetical protein
MTGTNVTGWMVKARAGVTLVCPVPSVVGVSREVGLTGVVAPGPVIGVRTSVGVMVTIGNTTSGVGVDVVVGPD